MTATRVMAAKIGRTGNVGNSGKGDTPFHESAWIE